MNLSGSKRCKSPIALIVMGPSACGKSEVATALSRHYECEYIDADSLHSSSNIEKMSNGIPLTDQDRFPWLKIVREKLVTVLQNKISSIEPNDDCTENVCVVVACSSLRKSYREILGGNFETSNDGPSFRTFFIFLNCSLSVLENRIAQREGHFMKASLLQSQLNTLEKPSDDELAITVNGDQSLTLIVSDVAAKLDSFSK